MKKYSTNLEEMVAKIRVLQPALTDMLEEHVLSPDDKFMSSYNGEWIEDTHGQVSTKSGCCLFLYDNKLELTADASIVAVVANSVTEYDYCSWCNVKVLPMADGCRNHTTLHVEATWSRYK